MVLITAHADVVGVIHSASAYPRLQVGSDVDNLDRPNARDPPATARRERVDIAESVFVDYVEGRR